MKTKGFTLAEILISMGIMILLAVAVLFVFGDRSTDRMMKDREGVLAIFEEARSLSMSSKNASKYGVYLEASGATLFMGDNYVPNDPQNKTHSLHSSIEISNINLSGGGSQIIFSRFNGDTANHGSFKLKVKNNSTSSTTIFVLPSGVLE